MINSVLIKNNDWMSDVFNDFFGNVRVYNRDFLKERFGASNITTKDGKYIIEIILYGIDKKDIDIEVTKGHLTINVKGKGKFDRYIGEELDLESLEAELKNGILTITGKEKNYISKKINIK